MAFTQYARKLYFNISWASGSTLSTKIIPCTPFRNSVTIGDRYGALLEALPALTGNSPNTTKERNSVTAFFTPRSGGTNPPTSAGGPVYVDFVGATLAQTGNNFSTQLLPYLSLDGTSVARNRGTDTIYGTMGQPRQFAVRLRRPALTTASFSGVLYIGRNHSIEV
jgi:hypothetical protein